MLHLMGIGVRQNDRGQRRKRLWIPAVACPHESGGGNDLQTIPTWGPVRVHTAGGASCNKTQSPSLPPRTRGRCVSPKPSAPRLRLGDHRLEEAVHGRANCLSPPKGLRAFGRSTFGGACATLRHAVNAYRILSLGTPSFGKVRLKSPPKPLFMLSMTIFG